MLQWIHIIVIYSSSEIGIKSEPLKLMHPYRSHEQCYLKSENTASPQMSPALPWWGEHRTQEWGFTNFTVVWHFWHECIIILLVMSVTGQRAERLHCSLRSADLDRALSSFHNWWVWKGWMSMPGHIADQRSSQEKSPEFYSIRLEFCPIEQAAITCYLVKGS